MIQLIFIFLFSVININVPTKGITPLCLIAYTLCYQIGLDIPSETDNYSYSIYKVQCTIPLYYVNENLLYILQFIAPQLALLHVP